MTDDLVKSAEEIIEKILYITIATVSADGQPWNSPVASVYDEVYNFYWGSHKEAQHSQNIRATGKVFLVIYDSTVEAGTGEGVYIQASAQQLDDLEEIKSARDVLQARYSKPYWKLEEVQGNAPVRLYQAVPQKVWRNVDATIDGVFVDKRAQIKLS